MSLRGGTSRGRAPALLALLCLALGGAIYLELQPPAIEAVAAPHAGAARAAPATPPGREVSFAMPPLGSYAVVTQRPLFLETRRPAPKAAAATDPKVAGFQLTGTLITAHETGALISHGQPAKQERFGVGQDVEGWTIESITNDRVVLVHGGSRIEIKTDMKAKDPVGPGRIGGPLLRGAAAAPAPPVTSVVAQPAIPQPPGDNNLALRLFGRLPGQGPAQGN